MSDTNMTNNSTSSFELTLPREEFSWENAFPSAKSPEESPALALSGGWVETKYSLASKLREREAGGSPLWDTWWPSCQTFTRSSWKAFLLCYLQCRWCLCDNIMVLQIFFPFNFEFFFCCVIRNLNTVRRSEFSVDESASCSHGDNTNWIYLWGHVLVIGKPHNTNDT